MKKFIEFTKDEILFNGHLQSLSAASVIFISHFFITSKPASFPLLLSVYLIFQIIFIYDRYKDIEKDEETNSQRSKHLKLYSHKIPQILAILIVILIVIHLLYSNITSLMVSLLIIIFGVLYNCYLKGLTKIIPMFKNFYVASFYALIAFFPYIFMQYSFIPSFPLILVSISFFIQFISDQIILDIKDIPSDKKNGLLTFPAMFGEKKALSFLVFYNPVLFGSLIVIAISTSNYILAFLFVFSLFVNIFQLKLISQRRLASYILAAGKIILWSLLFSAIIILR